MSPHDILTLYSAKTVEYLLAVLFIALFVPFWRYVQGGIPVHAHASVRESLASLVSQWFQVPAATYFHPGHAWAKVEADGLVTIGMDDFAQKLVGEVKGVRLPSVGARVVQGEPAWAIAADGKAVDMLSPIGGTVVAVNSAIEREPAAVNQDPYGKGWLLRLRAPRLSAHLAALRTGDAARRWMNEVAEGLASSLTPALGQVYQDGGLPVDGLAHSIAGEEWDALARRYLLTDTDTQAQGSGLTAQGGSGLTVQDEPAH